MPATLRESLPDRFNFDQFVKATGYRGQSYDAVKANWIWERSRKDPFKKWRNEDGLYNPDHRLNLHSGFHDASDTCK